MGNYQFFHLISTSTYFGGETQNQGNGNIHFWSYAFWITHTQHIHTCACTHSCVTYWCKKKKEKSWMLELEFLQNLCASPTIPGVATRRAFIRSGCVHVTQWKASMWFIVLGKPSGCRRDCRLPLICWEVTFYAEVALFSFASSSALCATAASESKRGWWWTEMCSPHLQTCCLTFNHAQPLSLACKFQINCAVCFVMEELRRCVHVFFF